MAASLSQIKCSPMIHVFLGPNPSRPSSWSPLSSWRPVKVTMSCNQKSYWASINEDIEAHLKQAIPVKEPLSVYEPLHYLTFAAPRNTAPALCVAACELVGGHRDQALPVASALHLMYAASYTHENLPLKESCRPKSMIHHKYSPNIELLTGDGLLPFGLELLARSDHPTQNISDRILRVIIEITRAIGSQGMIHGQYHEIESIQSDGNSSCHVEGIGSMCEKYEGSLHACAATCGAIIGGGSEEEIEKMRRYGLCVGKILGMSNKLKGNDKELVKLVEELSSSAMEELKGFNESKVEAISGFIEGNIMYD
ncbi:hypothetical protein SLE2022_018400 [Rubroshorea leprosula]